MKTTRIIVIFAIIINCAIVVSPGFAGEHAFGIGAHYFYNLDEIKDDLQSDLGDSFHEEGLSLNLSYRYKPNDHFGFMVEFQTFPQGYFDAETAISPRIMAVIGKSLYVGGGVGWNYVKWEDETESLHDSKRWSDPFYFLRAGLEFPLIVEDLKLDLNVTYEMNEWNDIEDYNSDTLSFGAGIRFSI